MATTSTFLQRTPPSELYSLARDLERWRTSAQRGRRIPEGLWEAAAKLARTYGVSRISAALKLSYYGLQRRARGGRAVKTRPSAQPTFVQVAAPVLSAGPDRHRTVEVVQASGCRLILRLPDAKPDDLLPLLQAFLGQRP
jgi:hypothetical protein